MILELALFLATRPPQEPKPVPEKPAISVEDEVLQNIKDQPLGSGTVADLGLPDEYLKRVGDRVIRASFEERYRIVVPDPPPPSAMPDKTQQHPSDAVPYQPPSGVNLPLILGSIALAGFVVYLIITARARKKMPL